MSRQAIVENLSGVQALVTEPHGATGMLRRLGYWVGLGSNRAFSATRWFGVLGSILICAVSIVTASQLSRIMSELMLRHDAASASEFVQGLLKTHDVQSFFLTKREKSPFPVQLDLSLRDTPLQQLFARIAAMPSVLHTNVYDIERRVVWSSNSKAINQIMADNDELDEALRGELVIESSSANLVTPAKMEHFFLAKHTERFVENYIPVYDRQQKSILGVVEIYKSPASIFAAIDTLVRWIWLCALLSAAALFAGLYWIMRRAERVMLHQQRQLVAGEAMAAVGELASAVAHGIRNPLASIRTSAELLIDGTNPQADDIVNEVDRLELWVRSLLTYANQGRAKSESIDLNQVLNAAVEGYRREFSRLNIKTLFALHADLPSIEGSPALLVQVFNSIIANAIEAMPQGGTLSLQTRITADRSGIALRFGDTGVGIAPDRLEKVFQPFSTNKRKGLGLGLPLVKRTLERLGGSIQLDSRVGHGTHVTLTFPIESP